MMPQLTDSQLVDYVIGTLARYGWNVDRGSLPMTLPIIMNQLRAHGQVAEVMVRYLQSPELMAIDMAVDSAAAQRDQ